jgi:hypothetical protein
LHGVGDHSAAPGGYGLAARSEELGQRGLERVLPAGRLGPG